MHKVFPHLQASPFASVLSAASVYFSTMTLALWSYLESLWANKSSVCTLDLLHMHENNWPGLPGSQGH